MGLVIPSTITSGLNSSLLEAPTESKPRDTTFWTKLLKIREFMAVCKVKVFQDDKGNEYFRIDNINEIDYSKKKKEESKKKITLSSFEENTEQL